MSHWTCHPFSLLKKWELKKRLCTALHLHMLYYTKTKYIEWNSFENSGLWDQKSISWEKMKNIYYLPMHLSPYRLFSVGWENISSICQIKNNFYFYALQDELTCCLIKKWKEMRLTTCLRWMMSMSIQQSMKYDSFFNKTLINKQGATTDMPSKWKVHSL